MFLLCQYPMTIAIATGIATAKTKVRPGTRGYGVDRSASISLRWLFGALGISATRRASALLSSFIKYTALLCDGQYRAIWLVMGGG